MPRAAERRASPKGGRGARSSRRQHSKYVRWPSDVELRACHSHSAEGEELVALILAAVGLLRETVQP